MSKLQAASSFLVVSLCVVLLASCESPTRARPEGTDLVMQIASVRDLAKFGSALREGSLLSPASYKILKSWRLIAGGDCPAWVGHGVFRETTKSGVMIGHSGSVLGYTGYVGWYEGCDVVVAVLTNAGSMNIGEPVMTASRLAQGLSFSTLVPAYARQSRGAEGEPVPQANRETCSLEVSRQEELYLGRCRNRASDHHCKS